MRSQEEELVLKSLEQSPLKKGSHPVCTPLPASGSSRKYFRISYPDQELEPPFLGVYHAERAENKAYLNFSQQFICKGLPVPKILYQDPSDPVYFVEDVGQNTLFEWLKTLPYAENKEGLPAHSPVSDLYKQVVDHLLRFQYIGGKDFDYTHAYPRAAFDQRSMEWDLSYFKYYFLKLSGTPFDEQALEEDFEKLIQFLLHAPNHTFLYRDFQSRNIMLRQIPPLTLGQKGCEIQWSFIDFQGGREGSAAYDLASLLYDAKANLSFELREEILQYYIAQSRLYGQNDARFSSWFYGFVYIRILQAMGAYGLRGLHERKILFLQSIPYAISNLYRLTQEHKLPIELPCLYRIIEHLQQSAWACYAEQTPPSKTTTPLSLNLSVYSFSYHQNIPKDTFANGGGFVFDCRGLPNPGRLSAYKDLTGHDPEVQTYLAQYSQVDAFVETCVQLSSFNIENYVERGFSNLSISFGCTGGQHRSVYCAELYAKKIREKYPLPIHIKHLAHPLQSSI